MQNDKKGFTYRRTVLLVMGAILLYWLLKELPMVGQALSTVWRMLFPFVLGCVFAFLLNLPMRFIENKLFRGRGGRLRRPASFTLSLVIVLFIILLMLNLVIPQVIDAVIQLVSRLPKYLDEVEVLLTPYLETYAPSIKQWLVDNDNLLTGMFNEVVQYLEGLGSSLFSSTVNVATSIVDRVVSVFISFVLTCYLLLSKERLLAQVDGVLLAYLPKRRYDQVRHVTSLTFRTYASFFTWQCMEALIEGLMFFVVLSIGRFDYALLISIVMAFMALVPVIGAWIGSIFGALMLLVSMGPLRMLAFIIITLIIQQVESNLIYPHVVGQNIGLPPIWTLVAVMVGSGVGGIFGILFFIPLFSVLYALGRQHTVGVLKRKGIENPVDRLAKAQTKRKHGKP